VSDIVVVSNVAVVVGETELDDVDDGLDIDEAVDEIELDDDGLDIDEAVGEIELDDVDDGLGIVEAADEVELEDVEAVEVFVVVELVLFELLVVVDVVEPKEIFS